MHNYLNREASAHAVLDAARAAQRLPGTSIPTDGPVGIWGHSQGGGAAAAAAESAGSYAPELDLRGSFISAPVADLDATFRTFDDGMLAAGTGYYLDALASNYPETAPVIDEMLNPAGKAMVEAVLEQCLFETALKYGFQNSRHWTTSGRPLPELLAENPTTRAILDANRIGNRTPNAPTFIVTGSNDDIVPAGQVRELADNWCSRGATVDLVEIPLPPFPFKTGLGHNINEYIANFGLASSVLDQMFNGAPVRNTCDSDAGRVTKADGALRFAGVIEETLGGA
ncbi:MAG: alpha/beta fold hydrolase [Rhodococcus sp.]|nr:alpha/beta fold hydrolase [Rhodococcus sp. (in: high G+C Gram-positive bacteria)]